MPDIKHPVINHDHYTVYVEHASGMRFIHMDVFKWSKTVKKAFTQDWNEIEAIEDGTVFVNVFAEIKS